MPGLDAQEVTASMTGKVTDASGAHITVANTQTGQRRESQTAASGDFLIALLRPGTYQLTAAHAGFKTFTRDGIVLEVNQRALVDVSLTVGEMSERVEISDMVPAINTENAIVGKVIDNKSISVMP